MKIDLIDFYTEDGVLLNGFVKKAESKKIIIATHGMSSNCFKEREKIIAEKCVLNNFSFLGYNNRGSELVKYIKKKSDNKVEKLLAGTTYEDSKDGYYDIKAAIKLAIDLGYEEIILYGHSLGCTKTVYTYNKLKEENSVFIKYIKGIILLSLVDIPRALKIFLGEKFEDYLKLALEKEKENKDSILMPKETFIHPISVKTFLSYAKYNEKINFAQFSNKDFEFKLLNNIDVPVFMRWGNVNEMIEQDAKELVGLVNNKIKNTHKDIGYIDGADHGYFDKEEQLANNIVKFINKL